MLLFIVSFHEAEFYLCFLTTDMNMSLGEVGPPGCNGGGTGHPPRVLFSNAHLDILLDLMS